MKHQYWLMKSEPSAYSIDDLEKDGETAWEGVRNYQARNFMMKEMQVGDLVLFYHSNAEPPGIAGLAKVAGPPVPDSTQFDKKSDYYDEKSKRENPRWICATIKFDKKFRNLLPLDQLKKDQALKEMLVLQKGQRLSVQPVEKKHFDHILKLVEKGG